MLLFLGSLKFYQLELDISSLYFEHHPLFSSEHVLSFQLEQAYSKYRAQDKNAVNYCDERVCDYLLHKDEVLPQN